VSVAVRTRALAGSSALSGVVLLVAMAASIAAQLMGHFGFSYSDAATVIFLVTSGSIVLFWIFPQLIPVIGVLRLVLIYFGTGAAIGW
jgi:hypothetical protein